MLALQQNCLSALEGTFYLCQTFDLIHFHDTRDLCFDCVLENDGPYLMKGMDAVILEPRKIKSDTVSTVSPSISHEVVGPDAIILVF